MTFHLFQPPDRYYRYTRLICLAVFAICGAVLAGWVWHIPSLITIKPGFFQMKVNTAAGLMLGSACLWFHVHRHHKQLAGKLSWLAGVLMLLLSGATLVEYLFDISLGIDQLLYRDVLEPNSRYPGRMALPTAVGMFVTAATLILLKESHRSAKWPLALATVSLLAWSALAVSYSYGLVEIYRFDAYGGISIPTVACFLLLNLGVLFVNARHGFMFYFTNPSYAGVAARRLLPACLMVPVLFGWLILTGRDVGVMDLRSALALEAMVIALIFTVLIGWSARALLKLERLASIRQTERLEALERAARLAHYDALTGLPNRVLLQERMNAAIRNAERRATNFALLFIDLDRFKPINDIHGHQAGDQVLKEISARLQAMVREIDTVARLGGDEFVVLLSETRSADDAAAIADKLIKTVERPYVVSEDEMFLSASVGIAVYPKDGSDPAALMEHADAAMYYAKSLGKRNFQFYAPTMTHEAMRRASVERQIRIALEEGGFTVEYQPKIGVRSRRLIGFEALVRLKPVDGRPPLSPVEFIPIAEDSGLIVPLGTWVLNEACRQNKAWQNAGYLPVPVSVNVSAVQFRSSEFAATVRQALKSTGLNPAYLDLEITETTIMQNFEHGVTLMRQLQAIGVGVSIDDFGTGSSSLSKLKLFSADTLKIDRSFIRDLPHDRDDAAITSTIIELARNLDQKVVAEGVETQEQLAFLQEHGCDEAQGFFFSAPLSAQRFEALYGKQW
ncbi:diguanylate cyclase (GGDEF) domain-containing protein [Noviherbaspirillum humi]|uniref:Diguanylate cyclase (GGDEF) domain-containing protein n=1 Tax=Noviherbaspirillum humi TaxID=1688639 RepID=A0A239F983_9BURK|nr:EAL domain-containing protein [Noviherbaspirillum humi]SNS53367.1 diguanylate cyclase (GGDEF) domain-containing protein [Noviherbaspirillum humi]